MITMYIPPPRLEWGKAGLYMGLVWFVSGNQAGWVRYYGNHGY